MSSFLMSWGMVFLYVVLNATGALAIKHKLNQLGAMPHDGIAIAVKYLATAFLAPQVILGFVAIFGSAVTWIIALSRLDLASAYPLAVGFNFVLVLSMSVLFLGESMSVVRLLGICLMIASVYLLVQT